MTWNEPAFRRSLLAGLAVLTVAGLGLVGQYALSRSFLFDRWAQRVNEQHHLLWDTVFDYSEGRHGELEEELEDWLLDTEGSFAEALELEDTALEEPFEPLFAKLFSQYRSLIRDELRFEPDDVEHRLLVARLAWLGEPGYELPVDAASGLALRLMFAEVPEPLHDLFEERLEGVREDWDILLDEAYAGNSEEDEDEEGEESEEDGEDEEGDEEDRPPLDSAVLLRTLSEEETLLDLDACGSLTNPEGETVLTNLGDVLEATPRGELTLQRATIPADLFRQLERPVERTERWCLTRRTVLDDGGILVLGLDVTAAQDHLRRLHWLGIAALAGGLVLVLALAGLAGRRGRRRLTALREVRNRVTEGELTARLPVSDTAGTDAAAGEVNALLDVLAGSVASLTQVTDDIAHDLRTPLTRLQAQLDLLKRSRHPSESMVEAVQDEASHLLSTITALLRIAQVESGSRRRGFRDFDMAAVLADIAELYGPALCDKGIHFDWRAPDGGIHLLGDPDLWMQALSNLLDNALKYTPEGGRVTLQLHGAIDGSAGRIVLRDSGPGIPEVEMENVFRRFYRLERHRHSRGNGLGLSLVGAICKLHGATIGLANDGGLVVTIQLG